MSIPTFSSSYDILTQKLRIEFTHTGTSVDIYGAFTADGKTAIDAGNFAHADVFAIAAEIPSTETYYVHQFVGSDANLGWPTAGRVLDVEFNLNIAVADHATPTDYSVNFVDGMFSYSDPAAARIYNTHKLAERIQIPDAQTILKYYELEVLSLEAVGIGGSTIGANLKLTIYEWDTDYDTTLLYSEPIIVDVVPEFKMKMWGTYCVYRFQEPVTVTPGGEYLVVLELDDPTHGSYNICYPVMTIESQSDTGVYTDVSINGVNPIGDTAPNFVNDGAVAYHLEQGSRIQIGSSDYLYSVKESIDLAAFGSGEIKLTSGLKEATAGGESITLRDEYYYDGAITTDRRIAAVFGNLDQIYLPPKSDVVILVDLVNFLDTLTIDPVTNLHGMPFATRNTRVLTRSDGRTLGGRLTTTIHAHKQRFQISIRMTSTSIAEDLMEWWERREFYICFMPRTEAANRFGSIKQVRWIEGPPEFANVGNKQVIGYHDVEMVLEEV